MPSLESCLKHANYLGSDSVMDGDAPLAQPLGLEVAIEEIEHCQVAMATSSRPFSLPEEATEW